MSQRRNRRAGVEDRWRKTIHDADGNAKVVPSANDGKGKRWRARYVDDLGNEHQKNFARKADANTWLDDQTAALVGGSYVDPKRGAITFTSFYTEWSKSQIWETGTRRAMDLACGSVTFGDLPLSKLDEPHVQQWIKMMVDKPLAPGTIHTRFVNVRTVIRAAMRGRNRALAFDPTENVKTPSLGDKRPRIPTPDEVRRLLDAADDQFVAVVALAAFAGLRLGEIAALQPADVRFLAKEIRVDRQVQRENGKQVDIKAPKYDSFRTVPTDERLLTYVSEHLRKYSPGDDPTRWIFPGEEIPGSDDRHPWHQNSIGYRWRRTKESAALSWNPHLHDLRHFFASGLIAAGCDVVTVQKALGHKNPTVTLTTYAHLWPDGADRTRAAVGNLFKQIDEAAKPPAGALRALGPKTPADL